MKIYYSNIGKDCLIGDYYNKKIGCLISYYGLKKVPEFPFCDSLFLDSGAFSARRKGIAIDLDKYLSFVNLHKEKFQVIASLDVIGDAKKSYENYVESLRQGFTLLPCFHYGEDFDYLYKYLDTTDYVALGGIARLFGRLRFGWLDGVFNLNLPVKFHGFGIQEPSIIQMFPWHTVDSSTWAVAARFGELCTVYGRMSVSSIVLASRIAWKAVLADLFVARNYVESLGFSWADVEGGAPKSTNFREVINILYYESLVNNKVCIYRPRKGFF